MARARTIVISHRRGNASAEGAPGASFTACVASVFGGKADLSLAIVKGVVQAAGPKANRDWEWFDYAAGTFTPANGGFGWNGAPLLPVLLRTASGIDCFESYPVGPAGTLAGGTGWADAALLAAY